MIKLRLTINMFILFIVESFIIQLLGIFWFVTDPRSRSIKKRISLIYNSFHVFYYPVIFFLQLFMFIKFPKFLLPGGYVMEFIGITLFLLGILLAAWAKIAMKQSWGMPGQHDMKRQNILIAHGPFRYTRNPIYIAIFLFGFGYFLSIRSYLIVTMLVPLIHFTKAVYKEETLLEQYFGKDYRKYKKEVRRWL